MVGAIGAGLLLLPLAAHAQGPDPGGPAKYGLCTAYFAGSQQGQTEKHKAPPFQNLQNAASAANESVAQFCSDATPGGK